MQRFVSPNQDFIKEMVSANLAGGGMPLNLRHLPRSVLEKICHHSLMAAVLKEDPPTLDISVGPDDDYHHAIRGVSSITPQMAYIYYQADDDWFSFQLTATPGEGFDLSIFKLVNDAADEWEALDGDNNEDDLERFSEIAQDGLRYLEII